MHDSMLSLRRLLIVCCLSLPFTGQAFGFGVSEASSAFQQGTSAFKQGNYEGALAEFQRAEQLGKTGPDLTYNLAVTYYKLKQYAQARALFTRLESNPEWRDVARYNIGLIARRQNDRQTAISKFHQVASSDDRRLRYAANERLKELGVDDTAPPAPASSVNGLFRLSAGVDDNVIAFPEQLQHDPSQGEDSFTELLGYIQGYGNGYRGDGIRLYGFAYSRRFQDLDFLDTSAFGAGIYREQPLGDWTLEYGAGLSQISIARETLTSDARLRIGFTRKNGPYQYTLRYMPTLHSAGDAYPQLDGVTHRFDARWQRDTDDWKLHANYRLEIHDRETIRTATETFHYSRTRHQVELAADWRATPDFTLTFGTEIASVAYDGENRLTDTDGQVRQAQRKYDAIDFTIEAEYALSKNWHTAVTYRSENYEDTFELYTYDRSIISASLEYSF